MDIKKFMGDENELPLDRIIEGGGFVGIFRTIACVGDSLSSGEFQINRPDQPNQYLDMYDYSWGKHLERITGSNVHVFAQGGMTAKNYRESFAHLKGYWKPELAANAYIIALGVNDILNRGHELGTRDDVCLEDHTKNKDTFFGNYAAIIQRYKAIQPDAKFFLTTIPHSSDRGDERYKKTEAHAKAIYELADMFEGTYVIDLFKYAPDYDAEFKKNFFLYGHMNPMGYLFTARLFVSYIDYIIRHNMEDFKWVGLMGVDKSGAL